MVIFFISSKHFITELAQGSSYQFCLASFSESEILCFFFWVITETTCRENFQSPYAKTFSLYMVARFSLKQFITIIEVKPFSTNFPLLYPLNTSEYYTSTWIERCQSCLSLTSLIQGKLILLSLLSSSILLSFHIA